jgi:hypothetical protein
MMIKAERTNETLVNYQTTQRYNPEDNNFRTHRRENLKSHLDTYMCLHMGTDFSESQVCVTNSPGGQYQRIQNTADDKESAAKSQGTNGVELQGVHSPLLLLNCKNLLSQNETDHTQLNQLHNL